MECSDNYFHPAAGEPATVAYDVVGEDAPDAEELQEALSITYLRETY